MIDDVNAAVELVGPALIGATPLLSPLVAALTDDLGLDSGRRQWLRDDLGTVFAELEGFGAAVAAFDDLVTAVVDRSIHSSVIDARVVALDEVLNLSNRSLGASARTISGVLKDRRRDIDYVREHLDVVEPVKTVGGNPDALAGTDPADRLDWARRLLQEAPRSGRHVVWLAYASAKVRPARLTVGRCIFYDGPRLLEDLKQFDKAVDEGMSLRAARGIWELPAEMTSDDPLVQSRHNDLWWPSEDAWVAVRVDLGHGAFVDAVRSARDIAEALVRLAAFQKSRAGWLTLSGHFLFIDEVEAGFSGPFRRDDSIDPLIVGHQLGDWLALNRDDLSGHKVDQVDLQVVARDAKVLTPAEGTDPDIVLVEAVRIIERHATSFNTPWPKFMVNFTGPGAAIHEARTRPFNELTQLTAPMQPLWNSPLATALQTLRKDSSDGLTVLVDLGGAVELLPSAAAALPRYGRQSRRVRDLAADLATPKSIEAHLNELMRVHERMVARVRRIRNSLAHGGPAHPSVVGPASEFAALQAKRLTATAISGVLEGSPVPDALEDRRSKQARDVEEAGAAATTLDALFDYTDADEVGNEF